MVIAFMLIELGDRIEVFAAEIALEFVGDGRFFLCHNCSWKYVSENSESRAGM